MIKKSLALLGMCAMATSALAESNGVTMYGLVDTTIRFSTHEDAAGHNKFQETDGVLTGSRFGVYGNEDLGGNSKALFVLESGFSPDTGASQQGGRLFGRKAYVGIQGTPGALTLGRQYTVIHETIASNDVMALANLGLVAFQSGNYTGGVRQDNMLKYSAQFGGVSVAAQHAFGESAGSAATSSSDGAGVIYNNGPLHLGAAYQVMRDATNYFIATPNSNQKVWSLGGSYVAGKATFYVHYDNSRVDTADYRNQTLHVGMNYAFSPKWSLIALSNFDHLNHSDTSGNRVTSALMLDYALSKRTDVYIESDFTKLNGAWRTLGAQSSFPTPFFGNNTRLGVMTGVRLKF